MKKGLMSSCYCLRRFWATLCCYLTLFFISIPAVLAEEADSEQWSENVFLHLSEEHGEDAVKRLRSLYALAMDNRQLSVREKLDLVNDSLNEIPWVSDKRNWSQTDYWATPMETLARFGGDCEDIAIAKFMLLRLMGIPAQSLRLGYVKVKSSNEAHMVLVYSDVDNQALILDNLESLVLSHELRVDLLAVYLVDKDGTITLVSDNGHERKVTVVLDNRKVQKIETIRDKITNNLNQYRVINGGRALF